MSSPLLTRGAAPAATRRMAIPTANSRDVLRFLMFVIASAAVWLLIWQRQLPTAAALVICGSIVGASAVAAGSGQTVAALQGLLYLAALEPAIRMRVEGFPYLGVTYTVVAVAAIIALRSRTARPAVLPFASYGLYLLLELLGVVNTGAGPYARAVIVPSAALFTLLLLPARLQLDETSTRRVVAAYILGIVTLALLTVPGYVAGGIVWSSESNFGASAGMGPNQLSLLLAIAVFLAATLAQTVSGPARPLVWIGALGMALLMMLTFSRGGLYLLVGAGLLYGTISATRPGRFVAAAFVSAVIAGITIGIAYQITGGRVLDRYSEASTSQRTVLAGIGWRMALENPWTGVGTGNYYVVAENQEYFGSTTGAHNELIRAAAEHGFPGLFLWGGFVLTAFIAAARRTVPARRGIRIVLLAMAIVSLLYNGMKLTAQPLLVMIALAGYTVRPSPSAPLSRGHGPGHRSRTR